jgi:S-adenosylmethionine uptake transporter
MAASMTVAPVRSAPQTPHRLLPVAMAVLGIALFSIMDGLMKRASLASGVYTALLVRCLMGTVVLAPVWRLSAGRLPAPPVMRLHALRGALQAGLAAAFFWGVVRTPLAVGIAISFIAPLIALYLAAVMLGERIRRDAVIAALFGLGGVAVIGLSRMGEPDRSGDAGWGIAAILLSAVLYAWNIILQRKQALLAGPLEVALFQNLFAALAMLPVFPLLWRTPAPWELIDIAGSAVLASASLMLLSWAYARAEAQVLVPIEYTAFVWSALVGWLWFSEPVTRATLAGLALILVGVWLGTRRHPGPIIPPG